MGGTAVLELIEVEPGGGVVGSGTPDVEPCGGEIGNGPIGVPAFNGVFKGLWLAA